MKPFGISYIETDQANDAATRWLELLDSNWRDSASRQTGPCASFALSAVCLTRLAEHCNGVSRLTEKGRGLAGRAARIIQEAARYAADHCTPSHVFKAYRDYFNNSIRHNITFEMNFADWWAWWQADDR